MASEWLIIGGGIHGTHLSLHLTQRGGVKPARIRVLDPFPTPLAVWDRVTKAVGMEYLRSPIVHNLHWDQGSLGLYARIHQNEPTTRFIPPFGRPSLALFNAHAAHLIEKFQLDRLRLQGRALAVTPANGRWRVETDSGSLEADHIVLAIGLSDQPCWPEWAQKLRTSSKVQHVFASDFNRESLPDWTHAVVVGGGITAAQTALALAERNPGTVTLVRRHHERVADFDSEVGWMNAINLRGFAGISDWDERRRAIRAARHRGSMSVDSAMALEAAKTVGALNVLEDKVAEISGELGRQVTMRSGVSLSADLIVLCTGYEQLRPGGALVDQLAGDNGLQTASCGYPIVSQRLEWAKGLFVSGPLAELEIGPASRNIIGARMAGQRLHEID